MTITLKDVIKTIEEGNKDTADMKDGIKSLVTYFTGLGAAERNKEAAKKRVETASSGSTSTGGSGLDFSDLFSSKFLLPASIAFTAWMNDWDRWLRALNIGEALRPFRYVIDLMADGFRGVTATVTRVVDFFKDLSKIRLPDIQLPDFPTPRFLTQAGEAITDFIDFKIKLPAINFLDAAGRTVTDFLDMNIRQPVTRFVDAAGGVIGENFGIRMPEIPEGITNFFNRITGFFGDISTRFNNIDFTIPDGIKTSFTRMTSWFGDIKAWFQLIGESLDLSPFLDPIKNALGFADEVGEGGSGLLGFFGKMGGFFKAIARPLAPVMRILGGPIVQGVLSLIDFISGFWNAFGQTEEIDEFGDVRTLSLGERIMNGLVGGIDGLVQGLVDGLTTLLLNVPGYILEWLGFEDIGKKLQDANIDVSEIFTDIWNWFKNIPNALLSLIPSAEQIRQFIIDTLVTIPGGSTILGMLGVDDETLARAERTQALASGTENLAQMESDLASSLSGESNLAYFSRNEEAARNELRQQIEEQRRANAELQAQIEADRAAARAASVSLSQRGGDTNSTTNLTPGSAPVTVDQGAGWLVG